MQVELVERVYANRGCRARSRFLVGRTDITQYGGVDSVRKARNTCAVRIGADPVVADGLVCFQLRSEN